MNRPQTFIEKIKDYLGKKQEQFETYLKRNRSKLYFGLMIFSVVFYAITFVSVFFNEKAISVLSDVMKVSKPISQSENIVLENREYNPETGLLVLHMKLQEDGSKNLLVSQLAFTTKLNGETATYQTQVIQLDRSNYVIYVSGLKTWKAHQLTIKSDKENSREVYMVTRHDETLLKNSHLVIEDKTALIVKELQRQIEKHRSELIEVDNKIKKLQSDIEKHQSEIKTLVTEKEKQTAEERVKSDDKISRLNQSIDHLNQQIGEQKKEQERLKKEMDRLQEKIKSAQ